MSTFDRAAPRATRPPQAPSGPPSRLADAFAWFGGADLRALRESDTDRPFYSALGACALFFSLLSAFLVMSAVSYVTHVHHVWSLWWVLPLWTAIMSSLERLMLQVAGDRIVALVIVVIPRLAVSLLVAFSVGQIFALKAFEPEINDIITEQQLVTLRKVGPAVDDIYAGRINDLKGDVAMLQAHVTKVEKRIESENLRASERQRVEGGCGDRCTYLHGLAERDGERLDQMKTRNVDRIKDDNTKVAQLETERAAVLRKRIGDVRQKDGLLARKAALGKLQKQDAGVDYEVRLITLLLIALDLSAFAAKIVRVLTVKDSAYDKNVAGRRAQEGLAGDRRLEDAKTEQAKIRDEGRAARRRNKWNAEAQEFAHAGFDSGDVLGGTPIDGASLGDYAERMEDWERRSVVVPSPLRMGGAIGLALLVLTAVAAVLAGAQGAVIAVLAAAGGVALCAGTRGFGRAQAWALRPIFLTFVGGLAIPLVVLLLNV
jgi:Domain of unknown function (DUF4407)